MKLGIILGSGLENLELLNDYNEIETDTPFGKPSSPIITGKIKEIEIAIILRHGKKHEIPPSEVNNRANIFALKYEGCKNIISTSSVFSLKEDIKVGDLVILDQFIDFTKHRNITFYDKFEFGAMHASMENPFSEKLRKRLIKNCEELKFFNHQKGTAITIEGPTLSTKAENRIFQQWGADVISMTISPECILANEAELQYAAIAISSDYGCWKDKEEFDWELIKQIRKDTTEKLKRILLKTIDSFSREEEILSLKNKIRIIPNFPKPGVAFRDITTLLEDREGLKKAIEILYNKYKDKKIDVIIGIESHGFGIAGILAEKLNTGLAMIHKHEKFLGEMISEDYESENRLKRIQLHKDAIHPGQKVLLIDDLMDSGETASASCNLVEKFQGELVECAFMIELSELKGREKLSKWPIFSLLQFSANE